MLKQSARPSYKAWYAANKERLIAKASKRNKEQPERHRASVNKSYANTKESTRQRRAQQRYVRYWRDPEKARNIAIASRRKLRAEFLVAYGGRCKCCGESEPAFLTLEHKNRDGWKDRKIYSTSSSILSKLRREGWPQDSYEILCFNCNRATHEQGICPHRKLGGIQNG